MLTKNTHPDKHTKLLTAVPISKPGKLERTKSFLPWSSTYMLWCLDLAPYPKMLIMRPWQIMLEYNDRVEACRVSLLKSYQVCIKI